MIASFRYGASSAFESTPESFHLVPTEDQAMMKTNDHEEFQWSDSAEDLKLWGPRSAFKRQTKHSWPWMGMPAGRFPQVAPVTSCSLEIFYDRVSDLVFSRVHRTLLVTLLVGWSVCHAVEIFAKKVFKLLLPTCKRLMLFCIWPCLCNRLFSYWIPPNERIMLESFLMSKLYVFILN